MELNLADFAAGLDPMQRQTVMAKVMQGQQREADSAKLAALSQRARTFDPLAAAAPMMNNPAALAAVQSAQKSAQALKPDQLGSQGFMIPDTGEFVASPMYQDEQVAARQSRQDMLDARLDTTREQNALKRSMDQARQDSEAEFKRMRLEQTQQLERDKLAARKEADANRYSLQQSMLEVRRAAMEQSSAARGARAAAAQEKVDDRKDKEFDDRIQKFSVTLEKAGVPEFQEALGIAEARLNKHKLGALPGYGRILGALPGAALTDEGQMSRSDMQAAANIILKARSGAAVTDSEQRRFLTELASGAGMSEEALRSGWKNVRKLFDSKRGGLLAGVDDDILSEYNSRSGTNYERPKAAAPTPAVSTDTPRGGVDADVWKHMTPQEKALFK